MHRASVLCDGAWRTEDKAASAFCDGAFLKTLKRQAHVWNLHCISKYIAEVFICNFTAKWRRLCIDLFCYLRRLNLKSQQAEAYKYLLYAWAACTIYLHMSIYLSRGVYIYIHMNVYTFTWDAYLDPSQFHRGNEAHLCCEVIAWTPFAIFSVCNEPHR